MECTFNQVDQHSIPLAPQYLANGYYRIPFAPEASLELAVILPPNGGDNLVGIPLSLPMGWAQSPPYFCAFTKTGADLVNLLQAHYAILPAHPLEPVTQLNHVPATPNYHPTAHLPVQPAPSPTPLQYIDVYIDDFLAVAQ